MNRTQKMKSVVELILKKMSNIEMEYSSCFGNRKMFTASRVLDAISTDDGIYLNIHNCDLKIGGENDDDENDEILENELQQNFLTLLKSHKGVDFVRFIGSEKGHWPVVLRFSEDRAIYKHIENLRKKEKELQSQIGNFSIQFVKKMQAQKSKSKGCRYCNSSLTVSFLTTHSCPVCKNLLYSDTEIKALESLESKVSKIRLQISDLIS